MATLPKELRTYETSDGKRPFDEWLDGFNDKATLARIVARLNRVALGNLGDVKSVGSGVSELRLAFGKGYRVYFAREGDKIILLLCGGDKGSQDKDIREAKAYLQDYRRRDHGKKKQ
ncbi:MAG: addiction module killer protein [Bdellovibrionales bacterium CG10_big_fil_rev_8_21_14_0_10_45_34]|nr:MAG: addiction module killer protein [Bdellovibrionales bacterium CG10_big_fil_rev_8_21_14_0_10_45_34]